MSRICTICARAGSLRLKDKNIYPIMGAPLMAYSIAVAHGSGMFDQVIVTSDSQAYLDIGMKWGADDCVLRPDELASGTVGKVQGIAHAVKETEAKRGQKFHTIVDLDVTAPIRRIEDIQNAVSKYETTDATAVISAVESKATPYSNMFFKDDSDNLEPMISSAEIEAHTGSARPCYALNASIYVWQRDAFLATPATFFPKTKLYIMPTVSRYDVDSQDDVEYVAHILARPDAPYIRPVKNKDRML